MGTLSALKSWPLALGIFLLMLLVTATASTRQVTQVTWIKR